MTIKNFEDLEIWKLSLELVREVYDRSEQGLLSKDYILRDQIRRAVISISSNIVEGFEKNNNNELIRYLKISKGSAGEARAQLIIAHTLNYITDEELKLTSNKMVILSSQIGKFISYLELKRKNKEFKHVNK